MNKRAQCMLFFDIDGTLITADGNRTLPESAVLAIRKARANGHLAYINTGRVMVNVDDFLREIGFDGYVCGCGTYIVSDGQELLHHHVSKQRCREIAYKCRACGLAAVFEHTDHNAYDREVQGDGNREILDYFKSMGRKMIDDIDSEEFVFDKFAAWYEPDNERLKEFAEFVSDDFICINREGNFIEVVPKDFSKATGIKVLMDRYDIPLSRVYAFGDSNNDLDMLRYVQNSVAMGVCSDEVAAVSSYRTDTVLCDGIQKAMEHFGII